MQSGTNVCMSVLAYVCVWVGACVCPAQSRSELVYAGLGSVAHQNTTNKIKMQNGGREVTRRAARAFKHMLKNLQVGRATLDRLRVPSHWRAVIGLGPARSPSAVDPAFYN